MLDKIYELKAKYEAEIAKTQLKLEVLADLLALAPSTEEEVAVEETEEEVVEETDELASL